MAIRIGDRIPSATLTEMRDGAPRAVKTDELFAGKQAILFAVPGAFTPTCSAKHLPGFIQHAPEFAGKGIDLIACVSVNDAFVMGAWGHAQGAGDKVIMLADGNADFTKSVGLEMDAAKFGMGTRSQRYAMLLEDGVVKKLFVEEPGAYEVSSAEHMLKEV
jgi:glutaredoxin/glutathione-dependent peroxiredoxin